MTKSFWIAFLLIALSTPILLSQTNYYSHRGMEGNKVTTTTFTPTGIKYVETLNDNGTEIIKVPFKWFAGIGKADNKQVAIEIAQREAFATISRVINNSVSDYAELENVAQNGKVKQALTSCWEQFSQKLINGCEPFENVIISYDKRTGMYEAIVKVAIRGDIYQKLLNNTRNYYPNNLSEDELRIFKTTNEHILNASNSL